MFLTCPYVDQATQNPTMSIIAILRHHNSLPLGSWRKQVLPLNAETLLAYQTRSTP
jgi:hypothetical protein